MEIKITKKILNKIITDRLILEAVSNKYLSELAKIYSSTEVMQYIVDGKIWDLNKTQARIERFMQHWDNHKFGMWVLIEKSSNSIIGHCRLAYYMDYEGDNNISLHNKVELGYIIDKPFWGNGYATEVVNKIMQVGFEDYKLPGILATVLPDNITSKHVLSKSGLTHTGDAKIMGLIHDVYEITASEYRDSRLIPR